MNSCRTNPKKAGCIGGQRGWGYGWGGGRANATVIWYSFWGTKDLVAKSQRFPSSKELDAAGFSEKFLLKSVV